MTIQEIDRFFRIFSKKTPCPVRILLAGGAVANLLGGRRPTLDIDFAVKIERRLTKASAQIEAALLETSAKTGIPIEYSEEIDRWSSISYLDYDKHTIKYKKFGAVQIEIIQPPYWSIGKLSRYYPPDIKDMITVFKKQKTPSRILAKVWGEALRRSPRSTKSFLFRKQTEHFFREHGRKVWGKAFDAEQTISLFREKAEIAL